VFIKLNSYYVLFVLIYQISIWRELKLKKEAENENRDGEREEGIFLRIFINKGYTN